MFCSRYYPVISLLMFCLFLSACAPVQQMNNLATATLSPSLTATSQPTIEVPSTQAPHVLPKNYELPSWLADSNYQVFAMVTDVLEDSNEITFVNANTHEKFIIRVPSADISRYFWTPDGKSLGFIKADFLSVYLIDLKTGKVTENSIPESSSQCLSEYQKGKQPIIRYLRVYSSSPPDPFFLCSEPSFTISQEEKNGEKVMLLINPATEQKIELSDSSENLVVLNNAISPSQTQLAILQGSTPDPDDRNPMGTRISIYSLPTGKLISSYEGQFCLLKWSPDENKLLTTQTGSTACGSNAVPVILYPQNNQSQSITAIENAQHSKFYISIYNWSQDSNFLYYAYINPDRSNICRYDLRNDNITCPTSELEELNEYNVEYYELSPDEKFLTFLYGYSCQGCDEWGEPSSALTRIDGSDFFFIGKEIFRAEINSPYPYNTLTWRPSPNP